MENNKGNGQKQIAGAVLIVGVLIAGAILLKGKMPANPTGNDETVTKANLKDIKLAPIGVEEHLIGKKDAKVVVVEYSDTECPFCKNFQTTMQKVILERGDQVAWAYRHFPIAQLHPKAFNEAVATECAWEQGGNEIFWKYIDAVYARTESNNKLDPAELPKIATELGLDVNKFNTCLTDQKYAEKVQADMETGNAAGVNGTPKSFILKNGKVVDTIDGALFYEEVLKKIDAALGTTSK